MTRNEVTCSLVVLFLLPSSSNYYALVTRLVFPLACQGGLLHLLGLYNSYCSALLCSSFSFSCCSSLLRSSSLWLLSFFSVFSSGSNLSVGVFGFGQVLLLWPRRLQFEQMNGKSSPIRYSLRCRILLVLGRSAPRFLTIGGSVMPSDFKESVLTG